MIHTHTQNIYHLTLESFGYENIHHIISIVFWHIKSVSFNKKEESGGRREASKRHRRLYSNYKILSLQKNKIKSLKLLNSFFINCKY